jgi:hypothetical protein
MHLQIRLAACLLRQSKRHDGDRTMMRPIRATLQNAITDHARDVSKTFQ